jgi:hypothetical protein
MGQFFVRRRGNARDSTDELLSLSVPIEDLPAEAQARAQLYLEARRRSSPIRSAP